LAFVKITFQRNNVNPVFQRSRYEILKDVTEHPDFQTYESHIKLPGPIKKLQKSIMNIIRSCIEEFNRRFKERVNFLFRISHPLTPPS